MFFKLNLFYTYKKLKILNYNLGCFPFELKPPNFNSNYRKLIIHLSYKNILYTKNLMNFIVFTFENL